MRLESSHFHQGKNRWVQMSLHCQVKRGWISGSFKGEIDSQKILVGLWTKLCGYLLTGREDHIRADLDVVSSNILLTTSSIRHQECFYQWHSWLGGLYESINLQALLLRRRVRDLQVDKVTLRPKTVSESLIWIFCRLKKSLYSLKQSLRTWFGHFISVI